MWTVKAAGNSSLGIAHGDLKEEVLELHEGI